MKKYKEENTEAVSIVINDGRGVVAKSMEETPGGSSSNSGKMDSVKERSEIVKSTNEEDEDWKDFEKGSGGGGGGGTSVSGTSGGSTRNGSHIDSISYSIDDLDFIFEKFIQNNKGRDAFLNYMKLYHNGSPLLFLKSVEDYMILSQKQDQCNCAEYIINHFISKDCKFKINISLDVQQNTLDEFLEQKKKMTFSKDLFHIPLMIVNRELKEIYFPQFIRSIEMKIFIESCSKSEMKSVSIPRQKINNETLNYRCDNIGKDPIITDRDIIFLLTIAKDSLSSWKLLSQSSDHASYASKEKFNFGINRTDQGLKIYKMNGTLPYAFDDVMSCIIDPNRMKLYDSHISQVKPLELIKEDEQHAFPVAVRFVEFNFPWPMTGRNSVLASTVLYDDHEKRYIILQKSCMHPKAKLNSNMIYITTIGGWIVEQLDNDRCKYTNIHYIDIGGWHIDMVWDLLCWRRSNSIHNGLINVLKDNTKKKENSENSEDNMVFETLLLNNSSKNYEKLIANHKFQTKKEKVLFAPLAQSQARYSVQNKKKRDKMKESMVMFDNHPKGTKSTAPADTKKSNTSKPSSAGQVKKAIDEHRKSKNSTQSNILPSPIVKIECSGEDLEKKRSTLKNTSGNNIETGTGMNSTSNNSEERSNASRIKDGNI